MVTSQVEPLSALYEQDETAWLEIMAKLVAKKRFAELDHQHLSDYLNDMAKRDRREVRSRLVQLLLHLLKWEYQPENRAASGISGAHCSSSAADYGLCSLPGRVAQAAPDEALRRRITRKGLRQFAKPVNWQAKCESGRGQRFLSPISFG